MTGILSATCTLYVPLESEARLGDTKAGWEVGRMCYWSLHSVSGLMSATALPAKKRIICLVRLPTTQAFGKAQLRQRACFWSNNTTEGFPTMIVSAEHAYTAKQAFKPVRVLFIHPARKWN